nr:hypothetical protein [Pseudodesulfovibrio sp.]
MKKSFLSIIFFLLLILPAQAQDANRQKCLESTVQFYNCLKGGTELQRNLATTYLLGAIQTLGALDLIEIPKNKNMAHFRFEYLDFVELNARIHDERPGHGMVMYLLQTYGKETNSEGMKYVKSLDLIR